jgi:DNA-binding protein H-NS
MATKKLAEIKAQLEKLQAEYDAVLEEESATKLEEVREIVATYGFTAEDIFKTKRTRKPSDPSKAKLYRNPKTGEEYHGKGKPPKSFAEVGKDVWHKWLVE